MVLSKDQIIASGKISTFIENNKAGVFLLSGGAGTGKTAVVTSLLKPKDTLYLGATNKVVKVLRDNLTKGLSAKQRRSIKSMTIAKFLGFKMAKDHNDETQYTYRDFFEILTDLQEFDNVVIDEVSLINDDVIEYIKDISRNTTSVSYR